jgi:hypothetical protein
MTVLGGSGYYLARVVRSRSQGSVATPPWGDVLLFASGGLIMTLGVIVQWLTELRLDASQPGFLFGGILVGLALGRG